MATSATWGRLGEHSLQIPPPSRSDAEPAPQRRRSATIAGNHLIEGEVIVPLGPVVACAGGSGAAAGRGGGVAWPWAGDRRTSDGWQMSLWLSRTPRTTSRPVNVENGRRFAVNRTSLLVEHVF